MQKVHFIQQEARRQSKRVYRVDIDFKNDFNAIDDISIFADTPEGMQKLLNILQEFTTWCGMQINVKNTYLLVIDND